MKVLTIAAASLALWAQPLLAQSSSDDDDTILKTMFPLIHCHAVVTVTADFLEAAKPEDTQTATMMRSRMADSRSVITVLIKPNKFDAAVYLETERLRGEDFTGSLEDKMKAFDGVESEWQSCLNLLKE